MDDAARFEAGVRHLGDTAVARDERPLLVQLPDARRPALLLGGSRQENQGAALRSREDGRRADDDHADSVRRAALAVHPAALHQERRGVRVRGDRASRRQHHDDEAQGDYDRPAGQAGARRANRRERHGRHPTTGTARPACRWTWHAPGTGAADQDPLLRVRHGHRQGDAQRRSCPRSSSSGLGHGVTGRQVGHLRPEPQPLHDGRRELGEGAEEPERLDDRRAPAHQGR